MPDASQGVRGIRTLPQDGNELTSAEETWVTNNTAIGTPTGEAPTGAVNGSNMTFTISSAVATASLVLFFVNGQFMIYGADKDYSISSTTLTMTWAPETGSRLYIIYWK